MNKRCANRIVERIGMRWGAYLYPLGSSLMASRAGDHVPISRLGTEFLTVVPPL
jgi:hypothetical protein